MFGLETIELKNKQGKNFYYNSRKIKKKLEEIEDLISKYRFLSSYSEPKREIREGIFGGYNSQIRENQSNAYKFILNRPDLTEENLHILYEILSNNQLDEYSELEEKGSYRQRGVYIVEPFSPLLVNSVCDKGLDPSLVPKYMKDLFAFLNRNDLDPFIKTQIAHLYFVFVHPFYDVNGRTAKTLSSWSLINNNKNPYTIINRGISFNRSDYLTSVKKSLKGNITPFLDFSLDTVKKEIQILIKLHLLRKEYNLTSEECETIELLLKSPKKTLPSLYNSFYYQKGINDKRLIVKKLLQLLEKNVVSYDKDTKEITLLDTKESKKGYRRSYESGQNRKFH